MAGRTVLGIVPSYLRGAELTSSDATANAPASDGHVVCERRRMAAAACAVRADGCETDRMHTPPGFYG